jgi:hypothetical protein
MSEATPINANVLVEFSRLELRNSNIVIENGLYQQPTVPIEVSTVTYKLYKRRWIGLTQLVLLNMLFGWNVCQFNPLSVS